MAARASVRRSPSGSGEEGVDVAINYVGRPEGAEETKDAIEHGVDICMKQMAAAGTHPILVAADVSQEDQVAAMFDQVLEQYGRVDILINNAGIQIAEDTEKLAVADFDKVLAVNLRGAFLCAQQARCASSSTAGRGGSIVNVSSVHQVIPKPRFVGYSVSKGGMQNLTHTLALEYAARGIRVNGIGPGATVTPDQPVLDRRPGQAAGGREPHPDAPRRRRGGDGGRDRLPLLGRGRLHHRADALRRRRARPSTRRSRPPGRASERRRCPRSASAASRSPHRLVAVALRRRRRGRRAERDRPRQVLDAVRLVRTRPGVRPRPRAARRHPGLPRPHVPAVPHHQRPPRQPAPPDAGAEGWGRNDVNWVVEQVTATQQMGTHMDGLNHLQVGDRTYNGHRIADIAEEHGTNRLGIDTLPQVVTRGLLRRRRRRARGRAAGAR